jgi:hypothetical protein
MDALSCGSSPPFKDGGVLQVEPLPNIFFAGTTVRVRELATKKVYEICMESFDKEDGTVVTIREDGKLRDLKKGEYVVVSRMRYDPCLDSLEERDYE